MTVIFWKIVGLIFALFLFTITLFYNANYVSANIEIYEVIISEIMYDADGSDTDREWIEIMSMKDGLNVEGWKLVEFSKDGKQINHRLSLMQGSWKLNLGEYAVIAEDSETFKQEYPEYKKTLLDSSFSLSNSGEELALKNATGEIVWKIEYFDVAESGFTAEWKNKSWIKGECEGGTPGEDMCLNEPVTENELEEDAKSLNSGSIFINEILPNPEGSEKEDEFIELYNAGIETVNLKGWEIRDGSKSGKYVFENDEKIKAGNFFVLYRKNYGFALNNSGEEVVRLLDPIGQEKNKIAYSGAARKNIAYAFDKASNQWRWTKYLTPNEENRFDEKPQARIETPKSAYRNTYAYFTAFVPKTYKVRWDFGDGKRSYKAKTKHKYKENGTYEGSVRISSESEELTYPFTVKVKTYSRKKVRIVALMPNPKGNDEENEYIIVKNKENKKINLNGWSVASGSSSKKLINHPITQNLIIKPGKEVKITREMSNFTLPNKKGKIELRYPDGKEAHNAKYKEEKSIKEDIEYRKIKGDGWHWVYVELPEGNKENKNNKDSKKIKIEKTERKEEAILIKEGMISKMKSENFWEKSIEKITPVELKKLKKSEEKVLGVDKVKIFLENDIYRFTSNHDSNPHYVIFFVESMTESINTRLNSLLNKI